MDTSPSVAAIVLSYNGREFLRLALPSLAALEHRPLEIVVVDNGSSDGSMEMLAAEFPEVTRLRVAENRGISHGINAGIRHALERGHDHLLLLNNDIEVAPDLLAPMLEMLDAHPDAACVGPKTYYHADPGRLWSAGGRLRFREAVTAERGMGEIDRGQYDVSGPVDYINGCCMLVPRAVMQEVGPWDPVYHVAVEDADWCARAVARGYRCYYAHRARLWHMVSPSTGGYTARRTFQTGRSTAIFVRRHGRRGQRLRHLAWFGLALLAAGLRELPRRNLAAVVAKLRGAREGWRLPLPPPPRF